MASMVTGRSLSPISSCRPQAMARGAQPLRLRADAKRNVRLQYQYSFEEICAKTLYNLADHSPGFSAQYLPPFDDDSPFWAIPIAIDFARELGIEDVTSICSLLRR